MKPSFLRCTLVVVSILLTLPLGVQAQDVVVLTVQPESRLWVEGTSNKKKDWKAEAGSLSGQIEIQGSALTPVLTGARFTIPAADLEGDASMGKFVMQRLMREALKVNEHPEITYELVSATPVEDTPNTLRTTGRLTLAGVTREIVMDVAWEALEGGRFRFTGSHPISMPDYDIDPPSVRTLGYHVGPDVTVHFDLVLGPDA
ncbi:MAG: hypothetical protein KatS3mg044_0029 [Rhodothermaceae bacterium]|nr:MAG: hypothetical protein KatS3mg044_0029 [Rhodothermaceae bacterium]